MAKNVGSRVSSNNKGSAARKDSNGHRRFNEGSVIQKGYSPKPITGTIGKPPKGGTGASSSDNK